MATGKKVSINLSSRSLPSDGASSGGGPSESHWSSAAKAEQFQFDPNFDELLSQSQKEQAEADLRHKEQLGKEIEALSREQITYTAQPIGKQLDGKDKLVICDLVFSMPTALAPPLAIKVRKDHINWRYDTLRTESTQKVTSGRSQARIGLTLYFVGSEAVSTGLTRLIAIFKSLPFVYIENSFIRTNLAPSSTDIIACSLVSMTVSTVPNLPTTIAVELDLLWFNYKPYAPNFWFRKTWNSVLDAPKSTTNLPDPNSRKAEGVDISDDTADPPINKEQPGVTYSGPTINPAESEPLQLLISNALIQAESRMAKAGAQVLFSNKIVFGYKEYMDVVGLDPQRVNIGNLDTTLLKSPDMTYLDNRYATTLMEPDAADALTRLALRFYSKYNKKLGIVSCFRTREQQEDTYQKHPNVAAPPGQSWHEVGLAVDLNVEVLNESEWRDLLAFAKQEGLSNLGVRNNYDMTFDQNGRRLPPYVLSLEEKKAHKVRDLNKEIMSNWETWHFDYLAGQQKAKRESGNSLTAAIAKKVNLLYYGKDPNADKDRRIYAEEMKKKLEAATVAGWEPDARASSSSKIVLFREHNFTVEEQDTELIPQSVVIARHNNIAELPIEGYEFSTQQYLGSSDMDAVIVFTALGERKLRELQAVVELVQRNSRGNRQLRDSAAMSISNSLFNMMGFNRCIIEGIESESVPGQPDMYNAVLRLSEYSPPVQSLIQSNFHPSYIWRDVAQFMWRQLALRATSETYEMLHKGFIAGIERGFGDEFKAIGVMNKLETIGRIAKALVLNSDNLAPAVVIYKNKLDDTVWKSKHMQSIIAHYLLPRSMSVLVGGDQCTVNPNTGMALKDPIPLKNHRLTEPVMELATVFAQMICSDATTLHPEILEELGLDPDKDKTIFDVIANNRRLKINEANWGTSDYIPYVDPNDPKAASTVVGLGDNNKYITAPSPKEQEYRGILIQKLKMATQKLFDSGAIFEPMFETLRKDTFAAIELFSRGVQCFPDLNLPAPPGGVGSEFDTPPDFWFYNEDIDGRMALSTLMESSTNKAKERMRTAYNSFKSFTDKKDWDRFYISYNKPEIEKASAGDSRSERFACLGSVLTGEDALGLDVIYSIPSDNIKGIIEAKADENEKKFNKLKLSRNTANISAGTSIDFGQSGSALGDIDLDEEKESETIKSPESPRLDKMITSSFANLDQQIYNLARAYPTFKIFFIEDDSNEAERIGYRNFDDFYSYSAVESIRVVRSRKIPADLCVITLSNVHGELDVLAFTDPRSNASKNSLRVVERFDPATVNTELENPFSKLVIVEGSKIQVKLGYSNDPNKLETVFNGQVVEIGTPGEGPDLIQIVCQSYAVELVAEEKDGGKYGTTQELLSTMICSPEITNFGRWRRTGTYDPHEIRSKRDGGNNNFVVMDAINAGRDRCLKMWDFYNKPQDDNIFAPNKEDYRDVIQSFWDTLYKWIPGVKIADDIGVLDTERTYCTWKVTAWDIFKEMELRHPGYVALPVPYGNRMTMFFGPPDHRYWARPLSIYEEEGWKKVRNLSHGVRMMAAMKELLSLKEAGKKYSPGELILKYASSGYNLVSPEFAKQQGKLGEEYNKLLDWLLKGRHQRYKPFRQYFLLSSEHNIVANNLTASSHGTFNAVELTHMDDVVDFSGLEKGKKATGAGLAVEEAIERHSEILEMKADDNIEDKDTRVMRAFYHSCNGSFFARRYAVGLLMESLRDVYKGTIVITGEPKLKPYDVCLIYDNYRDMYGPVEVEQVTHIFSKDTGFITEIIPDLILHHNNLTTMGSLEAMQSMAHDIAKTALEKYPETGFALPLGIAGFGFATGGVGFILAGWGGYKLTQWAQTRSPVFITPVTQGYKPLIAGLEGYKRDTILVNLQGTWQRFTTNLQDGWNTFWETQAIKTYFQENISNLLD